MIRNLLCGLVGLSLRVIIAIHFPVHLFYYLSFMYIYFRSLSSVVLLLL